MKKIHFLFIALVLILSVFLNKSIVNAQENEENKTEEEINQEEEQEKQEVINLIYECLDNIDSKLNDIDQKIDKVKEQKEFEYYPAIRLNVDTPMFGMTSLVENKLRVKKDISTSDVASKYSIRDIVANKTIRLPDSILGSIVMSTKEYDIDTDMTLPQAKLTLIKSIQYLSQVESANNFIDTQINNIFKDYIAENKKSSIKDIRDRKTKVEKILIDISDKINILAFLGQDVSSYKEEYANISNQLYNIGKSVKNSLILDDELNQLAKTSLSNESDVLDLQENVAKAYDEAVKNMNYGTLLQNVYSDLNSRTERMNTYIENSTTKIKEMVDGKEEEKTTVNYDVTSIATLEYMQITTNDINTQIDDYKKELENKNSEENVEQAVSEEETQEQTQEQDEQAKIEENQKKIDSLYSKYKEVLSREYKFYINNINMLLNDSNSKISSTIAEIDSGIEIDNELFNYTKYIYIDLPESLTNYINQNNLNSMLELDNLIEQLQTELNNLSNVDNSITKMYNNIVNEILNS